MIKSTIPTVIKALEEASAKIIEIDNREFKIEIKSDNSPVTEADNASNEILIKAISSLNIPIISEEKDHINYENRKNCEYIWSIDPLDGTREFIKKNGQFCICVALIKDGRSVLGFITDPINRTTLFGSKETGVQEIPFGHTEYFNPKHNIKAPKLNKTKTLAYSNSPFSETSLKFVTALENQFGKVNVIRKGSALKFIDLVKGKADFYVRYAPTMEWDIAAGQAIYETLGGEVLNIETNQPLTYNKKLLKNPYFLAKLKTTKLNNYE
jgi:3'(2'), 5'-bisphosphate nucleotidase